MVTCVTIYPSHHSDHKQQQRVQTGRKEWAVPWQVSELNKEVRKDKHGRKKILNKRNLKSLILAVTYAAYF